MKNIAPKTRWQELKKRNYPDPIHDTKDAREYAERLKRVTPEFSCELPLVMRVYFEKPRMTLGWKGLDGKRRRVPLLP